MRNLVLEEPSQQVLLLQVRAPIEVEGSNHFLERVFPLEVAEQDNSFKNYFYSCCLHKFICIVLKEDSLFGRSVCVTIKVINNTK